MDDLARHIGISKKTIYQHIDNKDDLVMRVGAKLILEETEEIERIFAESENAIDEMWQCAKMHVRHLRRVKPTVIYDLQKYYRAVWQGMIDHTNTTVVKWMRENLERGQQQGIYREEMNVDVIAKMHVAMSWSLVDEQTFPLHEYEREKLFLEFICYHMNGVLSERGREIFKKYLKEGL